ncbi:aquaporin [Basidiobolus meristosporus CBS 931.73]|uniref:Aquaporin n=1 Tax=Basidiobolus meristosporus CBS 931.73 TaxID=1314790 RepID=A0A1Y1Z694_9FUNG|nr:aquaporin [Basidiobolus meristosporus CBS 931.73]|eukprot:ORY05783.1 aquaporin [Basidiobolus meristosporus CBS 931.73]
MSEIEAGQHTEHDSLLGNRSQALNKWDHFKSEHKPALAEFLGTFVLVLFGLGVNAQNTFNSGASESAYLSNNIGWGLGLAAGIYVSGGVSGGHLNPAVTVAMAYLRKFSWNRVLSYIVAQFFGAFLAAVVVYHVYSPAFAELDENKASLAFAGIFATYPQPFNTIGSAFFAEFVGTAALTLGIFAITDERNNQGKGYVALAIGLHLTAVGISLGWMTGYALNPARDFAPRLFTALYGWGWQVFYAHSYYFWVPVVAPYVGGVAGGVLYNLFILS